MANEVSVCVVFSLKDPTRCVGATSSGCRTAGVESPILRQRSARSPSPSPGTDETFPVRLIYVTFDLSTGRWAGNEMGFFVKKVDLSSTQGALCTASVFFISHFNIWECVRTQRTPPACRCIIFYHAFGLYFCHYICRKVTDPACFVRTFAASGDLRHSIK